LVFVVYSLFSVVCLLMFGSALSQDVLDNVDKERGNWETYFLRFVFLIVLVCHIPFVFFTGKEALLMIIDEVDRKSISKAL